MIKNQENFNFNVILTENNSKLFIKNESIDEIMIRIIEPFFFNSNYDKIKFLKENIKISLKKKILKFNFFHSFCLGFYYLYYWINILGYKLKANQKEFTTIVIEK